MRRAILRKLFSFIKFDNEGFTPEKKRAALYALSSAAFAGLGYVLQKNFIKGFIYMAVELAFILLDRKSVV